MDSARIALDVIDTDCTLPPGTNANDIGIVVRNVDASASYSIGSFDFMVARDYLLFQPGPNGPDLIPITGDDPKFTRLYRIGRITTPLFDPIAPDFTVVATAKLVAKDGKPADSAVPGDAELCKLKIAQAKKAT